MDSYNAFIKEDIVCYPTGKGLLEACTFGVKDVFSVKGHTNAAGNPDWLRTHAPAMQHAPVIDRLLGKGAVLKGMTHTDELMYSLNGENVHYGTPVNPKTPQHIPGGSSSGSASAVAGGMVDFALGTDTGGSVRIPSSYCGIYGFRPTHGVVSAEGVIPLAPSFDTVGWMANSSQMLQQVGQAILGEKVSQQESSPFHTLIIGRDAWDLMMPEVESLFKEPLNNLKEMHAHVRTEVVSEEGLDQWFQTFKHLQAQEIWHEHGDWIQAEQPTFGEDIHERFSWAAELETKDLSHYTTSRYEITQRLKERLGEGEVLAIPTTPGLSPKRAAPAEKLEDLRARTMQLSCIAGLTGLPQVTIPIISKQGLPVGLSLIANHNQDKELLNWAARVSDELIKPESYNERGEIFETDRF